MMAILSTAHSFTLLYAMLAKAKTFQGKRFVLGSSSSSLAFQFSARHLIQLKKKKMDGAKPEHEQKQNR